MKATKKEICIDGYLDHFQWLWNLLKFLWSSTFPILTTQVQLFFRNLIVLMLTSPFRPLPCSDCASCPHPRFLAKQAVALRWCRCSFRTRLLMQHGGLGVFRPLRLRKNTPKWLGWFYMSYNGSLSLGCVFHIPTSLDPPCTCNDGAPTEDTITLGVTVAGWGGSHLRCSK